MARSTSAGRPRTAIKKLVLAILGQAICDYRDDPEHRVEVREWVEERNGAAPFAFDAICGYLNFDPSYVGQGFLRAVDRVDLRERLQARGRFSRNARGSTTNPSRQQANGQNVKRWASWRRN